MTVEEIIRELEIGNNVVLESGKTYDFTDKHSILVNGYLNGNGSTIISKNLIPNGQMKFLFNLMQDGTIINLNIIGPNQNIGPGTSSENYWGAVNVLNRGTIKNCNFSNCDKWAIRCTSHPSIVDQVSISNCTFNNIKRMGRHLF